MTSAGESATRSLLLVRRRTLIHGLLGAWGAAAAECR
jgi:hypothetical protein